MFGSPGGGKSHVPWLALAGDSDCGMASVTPFSRDSPQRKRDADRLGRELLQQGCVGQHKIGQQTLMPRTRHLFSFPFTKATITSAEGFLKLSQEAGQMICQRRSQTQIFNKLQARALCSLP